VLGKDHHALFSGQLKQRGNAKPYTIPLLVPFKSFIHGHGFMTLQAMQGHEKLPNDEAKDKYQTMVGDAVSEPVFSINFRMARRNHTTSGQSMWP